MKQINIFEDTYDLIKKLRWLKENNMSDDSLIHIAIEKKILRIEEQKKWENR